MNFIEIFIHEPWISWILITSNMNFMYLHWCLHAAYELHEFRNRIMCLHTAQSTHECSAHSREQFNYNFMNQLFWNCSISLFSFAISHLLPKPTEEVPADYCSVPPLSGIPKNIPFRWFGRKFTYLDSATFNPISHIEYPIWLAAAKRQEVDFILILNVICLNKLSCPPEHRFSFWAASQCIRW